MKTPCFLFATLLLMSHADAQKKPFEANYDESKIPPYTLPDPLKANDGTMITGAAAWESLRRPEILNLFATKMFGKTPAAPQPTAELVESSDSALGGIARREQWLVTLDKKPGSPKVAVLIYLPAKAEGKVPAFLGLNFMGNFTVADDPAILPPTLKEAKPHPDRAPGARKERWQAEMIVKRGYALVTAHYEDIDPDTDDGFQNGPHPLFYKEGQTKPGPDEWGSIAAWAWGCSAILDTLLSHERIDASKVALFGHSRLGKTALWGGATDPRFAMVISNNSGCGGAALNRRAIGETVGRINTSFPHWFCENFKAFNEKENTMPFDQHELIALIAPRPVYVASAEEDKWADPKGEFLSLLHAVPVYELYGKDPLGAKDMPGLEQPVGNVMGYHIRKGPHDVTAYDWEQYLAFADKWLRHTPPKQP